jgi:hypothetical protein
MPDSEDEEAVISSFVMLYYYYYYYCCCCCCCCYTLMTNTRILLHLLTIYIYRWLKLLAKGELGDSNLTTDRIRDYGTSLLWRCLNSEGTRTPVAAML